MWMSSCLPPLTEQTILSPYNRLRTLTKNLLAIDIWVYLKTLFYSISLYMSVLMPVPYCFCYCSFESGLKLEIVSFSVSFFFFRLFWLFRAPCNSIWIWESAFPFWGGGGKFWEFIQIVLNLHVTLRGIGLLSFLTLPVQGHRRSFIYFIVIYNF